MIILDLPDTAITVLLEDFKARWQELLNTGAEVSSWSTVYYTALVLTIGWVLGRKGREGLRDLFTRDRPAETFLVISLALVNAVYILGIAVRSYHIQQIALYLYEVVDKRITLLSGEPFNSWEEYRRIRFQLSGQIGRPEDVRSIYYVLMLLLPAGVSASILGMYLKYDKPWRDYSWRMRMKVRRGLLRMVRRKYMSHTTARSWFTKAIRLPMDNRLRATSHSLNIYFTLVAAINIVAIVLTSYLSISTNNMWEASIKKGKNLSLNAPTISRADQINSGRALKVLWRVDAATQVGIDKATYASLLIEAKSQVSETLVELKNKQLRNEITGAVDDYLSAHRVWGVNQETNDYVNVDTTEIQELTKKYSIPLEKGDGKKIRREMILREMWLAARRHLDRASLLLASGPN